MNFILYPDLLCYTPVSEVNMAEGYGGAKPKTKTPERNKHLETTNVMCRRGENSSQTCLSRGNNSCQKYSINGGESCQNPTPSRENSLHKYSPRGENCCQTCSLRADNSCQNYSTPGHNSCQNCTSSSENSQQKYSQREESYHNKCSLKGDNCHHCSLKGDKCSQKCSSEVPGGMSNMCNNQMKACVASSINQLNGVSDVPVEAVTDHEMHDGTAPKLQSTEFHSKCVQDRNGYICTNMIQGVMQPENDKQETIHQQERNPQQGNNHQQENKHQKVKHLMQDQTHWEDSNIGNQRLYEIGKISKKEQEYLSAKERWKKSGLALRKYIADKLGFKNDRNKSVGTVDVDTEVDNKSSFFDKNDTAIKQKCLKADKKMSNDKLENSILSQSKQLENAKCGKKLTRSEGAEVGDGISRSRSFLKYLGLKKDRNSSKVDHGRLKASKSLEISSSDAWPESSTDTCLSPASDWSSETTLANHHSDKKIWTNQKCQSTQTHPSNDCKCHKLKHHQLDQVTKTKSVNKHKVKTHKSTKGPKDSREHKCSPLSACNPKTGKLKKEERGSTQYHGIAVENWDGILDDDVATSSDEEYEFVFGKIITS